MRDNPQTTRGRTDFSALDALLLAPLAAPFVLIPLGLLTWGIAQLSVDYVATIHAPAVPIGWWRWPWGWPGARLVEAAYAAFGLPASSAFSFLSPLRLSDDFDVAARALTALGINCVVAVLPLDLVGLLAAAVMKACLWMRARRSA